MTADEKQRYLETTTDKGNKRYVVWPFVIAQADDCRADVVSRLDFRFAH